MKKFLNAKSGLSAMATILTLLMFSLFLAVAVSLVTTGVHIGVQEEQGVQAFFIAEGGIHYAAMTNNFPNYIVTPAVNLGDGSFTTSVPQLSAAIDNAVTTINVSSTEGFITAPDGEYWTMISSDAVNPTPDLTLPSVCEKISFTGTTATSFTGGTRERHSSDPAFHLQDAVVLMYTWNTSITTTLNGNTSASTSRICVNATAGFTIPGFIQVADTNENQIEDVYCTGTGTTTSACGASCTGPTICFTGCTRKAFNGDGNGYAHTGGTSVYQSEIGVLTTSTGVVSNVLAGSVQRTVQATLGPK